MRIATLLLATLALAATTAEASRYIEPILVPLAGEGYQYDGGVERDASDSCREPSPALQFNAGSDGTLVPVDDEEDNFALAIQRSQIGSPVTIQLSPGPLVAELTKSGAMGPSAPAPAYDVQVWSPGCVELLAAGSASGSAPEVVSFVPERAGAYTIRVVPGPAAVTPLGPLFSGDPLSPEARTCHGFCVAKANGVIGYSLLASA